MLHLEGTFKVAKHSISIDFSSCGDVWTLGVAICAYAMGTGTWFLLIPLLLSEYLGVEKIGASYGMMRFCQVTTQRDLFVGKCWKCSCNFALAFFCVFLNLNMCLFRVYSCTLYKTIMYDCSLEFGT
jgi:hypothetical protein